ncbi:MAG: hypothetical protein JO300_13495 [Silvibacterium sp.]|nr:hypothetical protein [Silvibacterium sp.]
MAVSSDRPRQKRRSAPGSPRKRRSKSAGWLDSWWPLLLGIAITPLAVHAASIMALAGSDALTSLYPWPLLLKKTAFRLGGHAGEILSQTLMYIQFPMYGLLTSVILRSRSKWFALGVTAAVHSLACLAVLLSSGS